MSQSSGFNLLSSPIPFTTSVINKGIWDCNWMSYYWAVIYFLCMNLVLKKDSEQHAKEVELLVHSKSRYRRGRNNPGFSSLCHCSDLGTSQGQGAASACVAEVQMEWSQCGCAGRGLSVLTFLPAPAHGSGGRALSWGEATASCRTKRHIKWCLFSGSGSVLWMYNISN